jgi:hypothetical protein
MRLWDALSSLQLTIISLALLMALVVLCTLAQTQMGTFGAVQAYMRSFLVWWHIPSLPFGIPVFPGGVLVGLVLVLNLSAALIKRFDTSWSKSGLWITHAGLILLIAGEFFTGAFQVESLMNLEEGQTVNYTEGSREIELAITNTTNPSHDQVYSVPASLLKRSTSIDVPGTPITLHVKRYFENAALAMRQPNDPPAEATAGVGANVKISEQPPVASDDQMNQASALVEPIVKGQSQGVWLVSVGMGAPQSFVSEGQTFALALRPKRYFLPYTITLKQFRHDVYPGTDIPKNFSSLVHLSNPSTGEERDVLISMNQPMRYQGKTYYQYQMDVKHSVLQVVQNPGWRIPYISCTLITLGLMIHFGFTLGRSLKRGRTA